MKVKLLRKLRKEAKRNIRVMQERDHFSVRSYHEGRWVLLPGPIHFYSNKREAISYCDECRRYYILNKIERFVY